MTGSVFWFTGLPASGKTTVSTAFAQFLATKGERVRVLDGDQIRSQVGLVGFSLPARREYLRMVAWGASLLEQEGITVLVAVVSPERESREFARSLCKRFSEIYVATPLAICESRDPKGHYLRARKGELTEFTGVGSPYEVPLHPELTIDTSECSIEGNLSKLELLFRTVHPRGGMDGAV